jgi:hypothetical protein
VRDEPPRALDFCSLAALCDAFFPRIFVTRASWVPFGTVSFTVHFHCNAATLPAIGAHHLLANARPTRSATAASTKPPGRGAPAASGSR